MTNLQTISNGQDVQSAEIKVTNGGWNSSTAMKEYTESTISAELRKQRRKFNNKVAKSYTNEAFKLTNEQRIARANSQPSIKFGNWC